MSSTQPERAEVAAEASKGGPIGGAEQSTHDRFYVGGSWVESTSTHRIAVHEAGTGRVLARVADASEEDIDRAVKTATEAQLAWAATTPERRAQFLDAIAEGLRAETEALARSISREVGTPIRHSRAIQVGNPIEIIAGTTRALREFQFQEEIGNVLALRQAVGVVAAITPWNYPLQQVVAKVAPALAAGCTVVLKASEVAPLTAFILAQIVDATGLPPGVLNVLTGAGPTAGEGLVSHPLIDRISFTGSTRAGQRISQLAAERVIPVTLELGGKSASVILPGADVEKAAKFAVYNAFLNAGQTCTALTRLLVPKGDQERAVATAVETAEKLGLGDPLDESTRLGPLASEAQRDRVRGFISVGIAEGARLVTGGLDLPAGLGHGYFVAPTVFADVRPAMTIAQEEIFGPVLSVIPYGDEDEALEIANGTRYGLASAVWCADQDHALEFAKRLRAGTVEVNGGAFNLSAPFGGVKQSGHGREFGRYGLEEFLVAKSLQL
ncbi:MAG TPA: aldehyde dehydrogenase family protein [Candidatus Dormibacteraeota bacterium]|nr:aldehyde dehydrogenase family protein [Candidatus Dormibacteraeota bacterium]